jgi:hypothetical protein
MIQPFVDRTRLSLNAARAAWLLPLGGSRERVTVRPIRRQS